MPIALRIAFALAVALLAASCATVARRAPSAQGRETLLNPATRAVSRADRVEIAGRAERGVRDIGPQAWLLAVPPGELSLRLESVELRNRTNGETRVVDDEEQLAELDKAGIATGPLALADLGVLRRVRLAALRLDPQRDVAWQGARWTVASLEAEVRFPRWRAESVADSAFADPASSLRRMLELSVANVDGVARYAQAAPARSVEAAPGMWQPRPELSPGQPWLRVPVAADGLLAIDGRWLVENGLDAAALRPSDLQIVSRGREVLGIPTGIAGATFAGGARLLFPALASDSAETAERVYYVGRRANAEAPHGLEARFDEAPVRASYPRLWRVERDEHLQTRIGNFLSIREMAWVWDRLESGATKTFPFDLPALPLPAPGANARIVLYCAGSGKIGNATARLTINGASVGEEFALSGETSELRVEIPAGLLRRDGNEIAIAWNETGESAPVWLDAVELQFESLFRVGAGEHVADFSADPEARGPARLEVVGARPYRVVAIDVTDPDNPARLPVDVQTDTALVHATLSPATRIRIVEDDTVPRAPTARPTAWRDWHRRDYSADGVIVTHGRFAAEAERLAEMWRADGRETLVVDVDSIFEAYSFGEISSDAIRRFLSDAANEWAGRRPAHALLVGDCTGDGRGVSRSGVENLVPTHAIVEAGRGAGEEYASDAWYSWLCGDDEVADMIVGRISVATEDDARNVVDKIASYRAMKADAWSSRIVGLSDSGSFAEANRAMVGAGCDPDFVARILTAENFPWEDNFYLPEKIVTEDDAKVSPVFTSRIEREFDDGAAILAWTGHGSPNLWSNQRVWFGGGTDNSDNLRLANRDRLPFVAAFTCNNGAIDYPRPRWNVTIVEDMVRLPDGGAIGCFAPSGPGFPARHARLGEGLLRAATQLRVRELGMLSEMARLNFQAVVGPEEHSRMYLLLGDPTVALPSSAPSPALRVDPPQLADANAPQRLEVAVENSGDLVGDVVEVLDERGDALASAKLDGGLRAKLEFAAPVNAGRLRIVARGRTADGAFWQSGAVVPRGPADIAILQAVANEAGDGVRFHVANRSDFPGDAELVVDGERRIPISLDAFAAATISVAVESDAKFASLDAEIVPSARASRAASLPSARHREFVVRAANAPCDLALLPESVAWAPASDMAGTARWTVRVANVGAQVVPAKVAWTLEAADGSTESGEATTGAISPGHSNDAIVVAKTGIDPARGAVLRVRAVAGGAEDADPTDNEATWSCAPDDLANLAIRTGSVRVSPSHLAEGATIFVDAVVENAGAAESMPCRAGLFAADDAQFKSALDNMAGREAVEIPALAPGDAWPLRLRWDPVRNLGVESIVLAVDPSATLLERSRENNRAAIPLDIKSSWRLAPRGITARPRDEASIVLVAKVANLGETDARRVAVQFYADEQQTPDNLVGETIVDVVPANGEIEVEYLWDVRGWDLKKARRPSFVIAIKGSLQRTSSVTQ